MQDIPAEGRDAAPTPSLSSAERRTLRARAHDLDPVVMVGDAGLSDSVVAEIDRALGAHGLIKVRIFGDDRDARQAMALDIEQRTGCALVQAIGKLVVLWRPRPEDLDPASARPAAAPKRRVIGVPKKLAAEGKPAPRRRARPGVPRPFEEDAPRRAPAAPTRRAGPGMRSARGALDPSVARAVSGGASSGTRSPRGPAPARGAVPTRTGAPPRGAASGPRTGAGGARGGTAARTGGAGSAARDPAGGAPRGRTGSAGATVPGRSTGSAGRGTGAAGRSQPGTGSRAARPPAAGGTGARRPSSPSPARSPGTGSRGGARSGSATTGSARPGSRTRGGRRGP